MQGLIISSFAALLLSACATAPYSPAELDSVPFRDRAQTEVEGPVTVTAAVPGPEETRALFDLPLYDRGIQPVWLEVRNGTDSQIRYAPVGTDPDYFAPQEVAYVHRGGFNSDGKKQMNRYFYDMAMPRRIAPGETRSGFVFTHAYPGTKAFNVDLFGPSRDNDLSFTFFIDVPGFAPDHSDVYFEELYTAEQLREFTLDEFRAEIAAMDCQTCDAPGERQGAPINAVVVGEPGEVLQALIRSSWVETPRSPADMAAETSYFFDRPADVVFRKNQAESGERNELRFWLSPMRVDGAPVWLTQVTHHIGEGKGRSQLDPDLDDAAAFFVQDIWYGQGLARFGWVRGSERVPYGSPKQTSAGETYFTTGNIVVMWLSGSAMSMLDAEVLDWDPGPSRDAQ
ncbi:MAG: LssY C-terminal domain-containing protein [Gammaproteobacteria bacterium]